VYPPWDGIVRDEDGVPRETATSYRIGSGKGKDRTLALQHAVRGSEMHRPFDLLIVPGT